MSETKTKEKKGFILRALDTVERVGNGLPNPATIIIVNTVPSAKNQVKLLTTVVTM